MRAPKTLDRLPLHLAVADVDLLRDRLLGDVVVPGDATYDAARQVWNAAVDRHPALVVRVRRVEDIVQTIAFARGHGLPLAVRSGGHSMAGHGTVDGGLVVDLSPMKGLSIDTRREVAWAEAGLTWGEYARQAHQYGLATPAGDTASVGLGGLTLGGGIGWLVRKHGLTVDNLLAAEVVTADGQVRMTSADEHPDLFWALRGGGGNFGIATAFQYRLHPVGTVLGGPLVYRATREVLRAYVEAAAAAPDELSTIANVVQAPPLPFIPPEAHGALVTMIAVCYVGDPGEGQRVLDGLRALAGERPLADLTRPMPYPALFDLTANAGQRRPHVVRSGYLDAIDDATLQTVLDHGRHTAARNGAFQLRVLGGAMARVPAEATAFAHRDAPLLVAVMNAWEDAADADRHVAWATSLWQVLEPRTIGAYVNFLDDEGEERVRAAYPPATYRRLAELKRRYDPDNLFRVNANIPPAP